MKTLYYVVTIQLDDVGDDILESNGWKTLTVYKIENNKPVNFFEIECGRSENSEEEIQAYLNNEGYADYEFNLQQL